jgi:hypothetical protein
MLRLHEILCALLNRGLPVFPNILDDTTDEARGETDRE